jgi:hypothetical protein
VSGILDLHSCITTLAAMVTHQDLLAVVAAFACVDFYYSYIFRTIDDHFGSRTAVAGSQHLQAISRTDERLRTQLLYTLSQDFFSGLESGPGKILGSMGRDILGQFLVGMSRDLWYMVTFSRVFRVRYRLKLFVGGYRRSFSSYGSLVIMT